MDDTAFTGSSVSDIDAWLEPIFLASFSSRQFGPDPRRPAVCRPVLRASSSSLSSILCAIA